MLGFIQTTILFFFFFFNFLAMLLGMWDLSSLTVQQLSPCIEKCGILTTGLPESPQPLSYLILPQMILLECTGCKAVNTPILQINTIAVSLLSACSSQMCQSHRGSFFFFSAFSNCLSEELGGQRLRRVEVEASREVYHQATSRPHHLQAAAVMGCPGGQAALKAAIAGRLSVAGLWESGWEMARQRAKTFTLMDPGFSSFPTRSPPTREMGL